MFKKDFLLIAVLGGTMASGPGVRAEDSDLSHPQSAIHAFNQGVEDFNGGRSNDAIPHFDDAISDDSNFAEAYYARGACKYALKNSEGALMDLTDAIRLNPDMIDARSLRGVIYYESDQFDQALDDFSAVLQVKPKDPQSLLGRGVIRLKKNQTTGAVSDFRAFLRVRPKDPMAPRLRQLLARLGGSSDEATTARTPESSEPSDTSSGRARRTDDDVQAIADSLMRRRHDLSDAYTKSVIRGDPMPVVGNPDTPPPAKTSNSGVDIVDPGQ